MRIHATALTVALFGAGAAGCAFDFDQFVLPVGDGGAGVGGTGGEGAGVGGGTSSSGGAGGEPLGGEGGMGGRGPGPQPADQVVVGDRFTCALTRAGDVYCWGNQNNGVLGDAETGNVARPQPQRVELAEPATVLTAGQRHVCAIVGQSGTLVCWGDNSEGAVGVDAIDDHLAPAVVPVRDPDDDPLPEGLAVFDVAAGGGHTCARTSESASNDLFCWGSNERGQSLDDNTAFPVYGPQRTSVLGIISGLLMGKTHGCALVATPDIGLFCWGDNTYEQLASSTVAQGEFSSSTVVADFVPTGFQAYAIGGGDHGCALGGSGIYCFGSSSAGQSGGSSPGNFTGTVDLPFDTDAVFTGVDGTCARRTAELTYGCIGNNDFGQLALPEQQPYFEAEDADLMTGLSAVALGRFHGCGVTPAGAVRCWGDNLYGQLGTAERVSSNELVIGE